jgi:hypothetical protein
MIMALRGFGHATSDPVTSQQSYDFIDPSHPPKNVHNIKDVIPVLIIIIPKLMTPSSRFKRKMFL